MSDAAEMFDRRAGGYDRFIESHKNDKDISRFMEVYFSMMERIMERSSHTGKSVLDIGTGTGTLALGMSKTAERVVGIDVSEGMLEAARKKAAEGGMENVEFRTGGFPNPAIGEKFDVIVSSLAFHHLENEEKREAVRSMKAMLNGGGRIVLGDVMMFLNPEKESEKWKAICTDISMFMKKLGQGINLFEERPSSADEMVKMFEDSGFSVDIEELFPIAGVLCAVKSP